MYLEKALESWHQSGPAMCKNISLVSAWLRFATCGRQRGGERGAKALCVPLHHLPWPFPLWLGKAFGGTVAACIWPTRIWPTRIVGYVGSQPEECRSLTRVLVAHKKAVIRGAGPQGHLLPSPLLREGCCRASCSGGLGQPFVGRGDSDGCKEKCERAVDLWRSQKDYSHRKKNKKEKSCLWVGNKPKKLWINEIYLCQEWECVAWAFTW